MTKTKLSATSLISNSSSSYRHMCKGKSTVTFYLAFSLGASESFLIFRSTSLKVSENKVKPKLNTHTTNGTTLIIKTSWSEFWNHWNPEFSQLIKSFIKSSMKSTKSYLLKPENTISDMRSTSKKGSRWDLEDDLWLAHLMCALIKGRFSFTGRS